MNDDDSDLFSWATDDDGANLDLMSPMSRDPWCNPAWPDPEQSLQLTFVATVRMGRDARLPWTATDLCTLLDEMEGEAEQ